jgi:hypothetical protein
MSASLSNLRLVLTAACALALAAIAVPGASAATACDASDPCLPLNLGFSLQREEGLTLVTSSLPFCFQPEYQL